VKQARFNFSEKKSVFKFAPERYKGADPKASWAKVVLDDPGKYPGLMQVIAQKAVARAHRMNLNQGENRG
jgi:hypothetical protein